MPNDVVESYAPAVAPGEMHRGASLAAHEEGK
jgi:hypothetical protein